MPVTDAVGANGVHMVAASRAAADLVLKRAEFELAVHLGIVRVEAQRSGGRPRVRQEEIDRLRSEKGFPGALRERVRTVGTAEGARLLGISPVRFARLARAGCVTPVAFYLNRYRAVVWLYLAQELGGLAARSPELLVGRSPAWMRDRLDSGSDCRPRNWRSRRIERLLSLTEDPWARAAVVAQTLDPAQLAEVVDDPYERAYFARVRPEPVFGQRGSSATQDTMGRLMLADEPDEILWRRVNLIMELDSAREVRQAPRPGDERRADVEAFDRPPTAAVPFDPSDWAEPVDPAERVEPAHPAHPAGSAEPAEAVGLVGPGGPTEPRQHAELDGGDPARTAQPAVSASPLGLLARLRLRRVRGGRRRQERASRPAAHPAGRRPRGGHGSHGWKRPPAGPQMGPRREGAAVRDQEVAQEDRGWQSLPNVDQGSNHR
ncbi:DUF6397 family protein [Streptomyces sp. NPDC090231]|uniref:DUF6397 family protein n=1 Tax=unclassified Streptomyces TaxID=2593676 RepID=UPI00352D4AE6